MTPLTLGAIDESAIGPWQASIKAVVGKDADVDGLRARAAAAGTWHDHGAEFGVLDAGRLVALVQAFHCPRVSSPGSYEVGVLVLEPAERGHGVGTAALTVLTELLFVERKAHGCTSSPTSATQRCAAAASGSASCWKASCAAASSWTASCTTTPCTASLATTHACALTPGLRRRCRVVEHRVAGGDRAASGTVWNHLAGGVDQRPRAGRA